MQAKDIFDQAVLLEPGETIVIPTTSPAAMNSLRSALARQRMLWRNAVNPEDDVLIRRVTEGGSTKVIIERVDTQPPIIKTKVDGTEEVL